MREIVAMLPMAGSGERLGMPFPKPLSPTFVKGNHIKPLYWHALEAIKDAGITQVFGIVSAEDLMRWHGFDAFPILPKPTRSNAIDTIIWGAGFAGDTDILVMLPDVIIHHSWVRNSDRPIKMFVKWHRQYNQKDDKLSVGLVSNGDNTFDHLMQGEKAYFLDKDSLHVEEGTNAMTPDGAVTTGYGWVTLIGPAKTFLGWDKYLSWAENINNSDWAPVNLGTRAYDLGTPERYMDYMDTRKVGW